MSKPKAKVSMIVVEVGGKDIELSLEEAKELYDVLHELFKKETYLPPIPYIPPVNPKPNEPWVTYTDNTDNTSEFGIRKARNAAEDELNSRNITDAELAVAAYKCIYGLTETGDEENEH